MGASRKAISREAMRFHDLIVQYERKGMSQQDLASRIGCHQSLVSKWRHPESSGRTGIGSEIIRGCMDGLGIRPEFFFDNFEGTRDVELYSFDRERKNAKERELEQKLAIMQNQLTEAVKQISKLAEAVSALTASQKPAAAR